MSVKALIRGAWSKASTGWRRGWRDQAGGVIMLFSLGAPLLLAGAGVAIDYGVLSTARADLQNAADSAALAAAREFRLGNTTTSTVTQVAESFARRALADSGQTGTVSASADQSKKTVTVSIEANIETTVIRFFGADSALVRAHATARTTGATSVCVIGLDPSKNDTVYLEKNAKLEALNCGVYSNSTKRDGLKALENSSLRARFICSAGGSYKDKFDAFSPSPTVDCPTINDPLAVREPPAVSGCTATDLKVTGSVILSPGTYCGGIVITNNAKVELRAGIYSFKDGPLDVRDGSALTGKNVNLYFNGKKSTVKFSIGSSISLTAPKDGEMAGILIYEDRSSPKDQKQEILSNDAKLLLGTIYLPQGELSIGGERPIAAESAYTIIVARRFALSAGPTMVINSNYGATNIPVPAGVGPNVIPAQLVD